MTRGYVCIVNGRNVENVAYLSSDAYLSCYGMKILNAAKEGAEAINNWIDAQYAENISCYGPKNDPCEGFKLNWIRPDKESKVYIGWSYSEYGYMYDSKNNKLSVYNYGKRLFVIDLSNCNEVEKYSYLFENYNLIYDGISYNEKLLADNISFVKCLKMAGESSAEVLQAAASRGSVERLYLDDYHCMAPGYSNQYPAYIKKLYSSCYANRRLDFIVQKSNLSNKWDVLLQTPFIRLYYKTASSEAEAVNLIRNLVKATGRNKLLRLGEMFQKYEDATEIMNAESAKKAFLNSLDEEWSKEPWFTFGIACYDGHGELTEYLSKDWFKKQLIHI